MHAHFPKKENKSICVLLAEDDDELRFILMRMLTNQGYRVEEVSEGNALYRRLAEISAQSVDECTVDIVVSDIFLSGVTAIEAIADLEGSLKSLPIILITSAYDPDISQKAHALGVRAVLSKPFEISELNQLIKEWA